MRIVGGRGDTTVPNCTMDSSSSTLINQTPGWINDPVSRRSQKGFIKGFIGGNLVDVSSRPNPTPIDIQVQVKRQIEIDESPLRNAPE